MPVDRELFRQALNELVRLKRSADNPARFRAQLYGCALTEPNFMGAHSRNGPDSLAWTSFGSIGLFTSGGRPRTASLSRTDVPGVFQPQRRPISTPLTLALNSRPTLRPRSSRTTPLAFCSPMPEAPPPTAMPPPTAV